MSIIIIDRQDNFSGLQHVHGQNWLILDAHECRFPLLIAFMLRQVIMLLGEVLFLEKSLNLIFEAAERISRGLKQSSQHPINVTLSQVIGGLQTLSFPHAKPEYLKSVLTELMDVKRSMGDVWDYAESSMMDELLLPGQHTVIRTRMLDLKEELLLVAWMMLYAIHTGLVSPRNYPVYFIVDELQHLFNRSFHDSKTLRTLKTNVLTARQPGVAIIGGAQMPSLLEPELLASAGTLICKGLQDTPNILAAAGAMGLSVQHAHELFQSLDVSEAIYQCLDRPGPFKIESPPSRLPKG